MTQENKKLTMVIGASPNPARYSHLAVQSLAAHGHPVIAIGKRNGTIGSITIQTNQPDIKGVDTATLYINPSLQSLYYDYLLSLHPRRIIFNPGTENKELEILAKKNNIETLEACTLVLLSTEQY
mgnify:CR=1 FL=1